MKLQILGYPPNYKGTWFGISLYETDFKGLYSIVKPDQGSQASSQAA
jgi:hypothetical protein